MPVSTIDLTTEAGFTQAVLQQGLTLSELHGLTSEQLEAIYFLASEDLAQGRYEEALDRTAFLAQQDPWQPRFIRAFALSLHHLGDFESAARFYTQALVMDATDALSAYRIGECLLAMGDLESAWEALETAVQLSWLDPENFEVRALAQRQLDGLAGSGGGA